MSAPAGENNAKEVVVQPEAEERDEVWTSANLEPKNMILNHGDAFGVYNENGDIPAQVSGASAFGFFYKGCRFLSQLELRVGGRNLLQLSSVVKDHNGLLAVNAMNEELAVEGSPTIPSGVLLFSRNKLIFDGVAYESVQVRNYDRTDHTLTLGFHFANDFRDIFEVRGCTRKARGEDLGFQKIDESSVRFSYQGLDKVERASILRFSESFTRVRAGTAAFRLHVPAQSERSLTFEVVPVIGGEQATSCGFEEAHRKLSEQRLQRRNLFATVSTSSGQFNRWFDHSVTDLISLLAEKPSGLYPYAGVPWYCTVFGRDGLITAYLTLWIAPEIAKGALLLLASLQAQKEDPINDAEPGKILHEARDGEMADLREIPFKQYYGSCDSTPLFLWLAGAYFRRTGDADTIDKLWPHLLAAMDWIKRYGDQDGDGFVEYHRKNVTGLHNQGWKDSHDSISHADGALAEPPTAVCEVQGYTYAAKLGMAEIARHRGEEEKARAWGEEAKLLKAKFNKDFWVEELGTFAIALDGEKKPCRVQSSNPGHCLLTGIVDEDKAAIMAKSLVGEDLLSGWGVRTLGCRERRYNPLSYHNGSVWPHDSAIVAMGLGRYGETKAAQQILGQLFDATLFIDGCRLPELMCGMKREEGDGPVRYPVACSPQAWSVAAIFGALQAVLGIEVDALSQTVHAKSPILPTGVESLKLLDLQVGKGHISLSFQNAGAGVEVDIVSRPEGWSFVGAK